MRKLRENSLFNVSILELANEFGIHKDSVHRKTLRAGIEVRLSSYGPAEQKMSCVTAQGAQAVRKLYQDRRGERPEGYISQQEAAVILKLSERSFERKKERVRRVRVGHQYFYLLSDIRQWAREEKERFGRMEAVPRGALGSVEFSGIISRTGGRRPLHWVRRNCPKHQTASGRVYYKPLEMLKWFEEGSDYRMKRYAERLRNYLGANGRSSGTGGL